MLSLLRCYRSYQAIIHCYDVTEIELESRPFAVDLLMHCNISSKSAWHHLTSNIELLHGEPLRLSASVKSEVFLGVMQPKL